MKEKIILIAAVNFVDEITSIKYNNNLLEIIANEKKHKVQVDRPNKSFIIHNKNIDRYEIINKVGYFKHKNTKQ
ncbi:hypothetical protein A0H76_13 [Hepatospora eriocheir]|uniref:Uncharacterized protein n=1 Tax=Hepatospora eriocheir TaxID=1081669 RepID=A0A1X0QLL6_9MICR|nr:hypothetical protein A0H76_13 [Hepatospora eriocheir]